MFERTLVLPPNRSCLLLGPRQTGKSTLVRAALPARSWTVDLLDRATQVRYAKDPGLFRAEVERKLDEGVEAVFVDEVQRVPELLDTAHLLIESRRARFILTGSSARKLVRGGANLLAGRASVRHLHPLTRAELGDAFDLQRVLTLGTLPPVASADRATAVEILSAYAQTYLQEEVQQEGLVRSLGGFARFLDVAAAQSGDILNYAAIARDCQIAHRSVQGYFQILEDTLLGFRLDSFRRSPRARLVAHPRFYLFDTGVANALAGTLGAAPDPARRGRLFENWLVTECFRRTDYEFPETRLHYWRTHQGVEVDLLFERHGRLRVAVEIKHRPRLVGADLSGLRAFGEAHPGVPLVAACTAPEPYRVGNVDVLPYTRFLEDLPGWL